MNVTNSCNVIEDIPAFKNYLGWVGQPHYLERLMVIPFPEEELVLILAPDHLFAPQRGRFLTGIDRAALHLKGSGSATRELVEAASELSSHPPLFP